MVKRTRFGLGRIEKILVLLSPALFGAIGWLLPNLLGLIKRFPFLPELEILNLIESIESLWTSLICMIIGLIFSHIVYKEALKGIVSEDYILISRYGNEKKIPKNDVRYVFMEEGEFVINNLDNEEVIREKTDMNKQKTKDLFLSYSYQWSDCDPFERECNQWKLDDSALDEKTNSILYKRRIALRNNDVKESNYLKKDLNELGVIVKDTGDEQYIRTVKKIKE